MTSLSALVATAGEVASADPAAVQRSASQLAQPPQIDIHNHVMDDVHKPGVSWARVESMVATAERLGINTLCCSHPISAVPWRRLRPFVKPMIQCWQPCSDIPNVFRVSPSYNPVMVLQPSTKSDGAWMPAWLALNFTISSSTPIQSFSRLPKSVLISAFHCLGTQPT